MVMALKPDLSNLSERLGNIAARFDDKFKRQRAPRKGSALEAFFNDLHDLFTRDVTGEGLRNLVRQDTRDTLRYFTREIDFAALRPLPWWKRFPTLTWQ